MSTAPPQPGQPTGPPQGPDPGGSHPGCADAHRRGQDERADPGDHPGRRRRDGLLLQPLRDQGAAVRGCCRGGDGRLRSAARRPDRGHRGPRRGVRLQFPAHRTASTQGAGAQPGLSQQRAPAAQRRQRPGATRPARHQGRRGCRPLRRRGPRRRGDDGSRSPASPSASCCSTSRSATSRRPPTG